MIEANCEEVLHTNVSKPDVAIDGDVSSPDSPERQVSSAR